MPPTAAAGAAASAGSPSSARPSDRHGRAEERVRDLGAQLGWPLAEALEPEGALVVPVQRVLPGEADAAVHLNRALTCPDGSLGRERFRGRRGHLRARVLFGDAPRRPVREGARKLDLGIRVGELVRDCLVHADLLAELLPRLRVLDAELERTLRDADGLRSHRRTQAGRLLRRAGNATK